jgi:hypothetical protein
MENVIRLSLRYRVVWRGKLTSIPEEGQLQTSTAQRQYVREQAQADVEERRKVSDIVKGYVEGKPQDIREIAYVAFYYPETMRQAQVAKTAPQIAERFIRGEPVDIQEIAPIAFYFPEYMEEVARYRREHPPTLVSQSISHLQMKGMYEASIHGYPTPLYSTYRSEQFYEKIGYPQYGGVYEPFTIPEGYKVQAIKETGEGLSVSFMAQMPKGWMPESIHTLGMGESERWFARTYKRRPSATAPVIQLPNVSEWLLSIRTKKPIAETPTEAAYQSVGIMATATPFAGFAGMLGSPLELAKAETWTEKPPTYVVGLTVSSIFLAYSVYETAKLVAAKTIVPKATAWLTERYLEKGPLAWKGTAEKLVGTLTGAKPYLAREVISVPSHSVAQVLSATELGMTTPRTSMLIFSRGFAKETKFIPKFLIRGTSIVPMAQTLSDVAYREMPYDWLKSAPEQIGIETVKQTLPELPYLPLIPSMLKKPSLVAVAYLGFKAGLLIPTETTRLPMVQVSRLQIAKPKLETPITPAMLTRPEVVLSLKPKVLTATQIIPAQIVRTSQAAQMKTRQIQKQTQLQRQLMKSPMQLQTYKPAYPRDYFELPKPRRKRKRKQAPFDLFGRYAIIRPIASPKEVLRKVIGK